MKCGRRASIRLRRVTFLIIQRKLTFEARNKVYDRVVHLKCIKAGMFRMEVVVTLGISSAKII